MVGFTLTEIKTIMDKWFSGTFGEKVQLDFFDAKIKEVNSKISQLKQMKKRLIEVKEDMLKGNCE